MSDVNVQRAPSAGYHCILTLKLMTGWTQYPEHLNNQYFHLQVTDEVRKIKVLKETELSF